MLALLLQFFLSIFLSVFELLPLFPFGVLLVLRHSACNLLPFVDPL